MLLCFALLLLIVFFLFLFFGGEGILRHCQKEGAGGSSAWRKLWGRGGGHVYENVTKNGSHMRLAVKQRVRRLIYWLVFGVTELPWGALLERVGFRLTPDKVKPVAQGRRTTQSVGGSVPTWFHKAS